MSSRTSATAHQAEERVWREYGVINLRSGLGPASIVMFIVGLASDAWSGWLPWAPRSVWQRPLVDIIALWGACLVGLLLAWVGSRRGDRGMARWGLMLNGTVVGVVTLTFIVLAAWWQLR